MSELTLLNFSMIWCHNRRLEQKMFPPNIESPNCLFDPKSKLNSAAEIYLRHFQKTMPCACTVNLSCVPVLCVLHLPFLISPVHIQSCRWSQSECKQSAVFFFLFGLQQSCWNWSCWSWPPNALGIIASTCYLGCMNSESYQHKLSFVSSAIRKPFCGVKTMFCVKINGELRAYRKGPPSLHVTINGCSTQWGLCSAIIGNYKFFYWNVQKFQFVLYVERYSNFVSRAHCSQLHYKLPDETFTKSKAEERRKQSNPYKSCMWTSQFCN